MISLFIIGLLACDWAVNEGATVVPQPPPTGQPAPAQPAVPPKTAAEWLAHPVRGAVIEIGYGGPDEYNDPPYPSVDNLKQLRALGVQVVALEFQYAWTIDPPYRADETQFALVTGALDNIAEAGLMAIVAVRNGPGRNAMMPGINDEDVITTLYQNEAAQAAYQKMLRDVIDRFQDRPEIIAWEPIIEPALDWFLTGEEEPPYSQAATLWNDLAPQLIAAIRNVDTERPILIEPVNWGGTDGFALLDRFDDDNLIYSLHTYEPFAFTHQETPPYHAYPGQFDGELFDKETLAELLEPVVAFQERYDVPIVVGEWGGIRWLPGIEQYIADQLSLFEAQGWSWFWYAWDDEEWDELGFELHMGPSREAPGYDPATPAFALLAAAWQQTSPAESPSALSFAYETRADAAIRLTDPPPEASDQNAAFAPDGTRLVFTRFENGYNIGPASVFLLDLADGRITRLTPAEDQDNVNLPGSAWNEVNDRIIFASDRGESDDLWRIAPDGTDFSPVTAHDGPPWYIEPSWSPDGQWIVFEADNNVPDDRQQGSIWKVRADGSDLTPLTDGPANGTDDRQPNWSPVGDRILFQRRDPGSENWDIYTMALDGADIRLVTDQPSSDTDASWSPDGRFIVYSSDYGDLPVPNIFVIPAEGGDPIRVTFSDDNEDGAPSWSPDGRWIVFESHLGEDEDTPSQLWRIEVSDLGGETTVTGNAALANVDQWLYLIDVNLEPDIVDKIAASTHDMVVFDFVPSEENNTDYPMAEVIAQLHQAPRPKLVIAYIDIGQAENYRTYWQPGWGIGNPEWIITGDPDGWEGNFPVAYWYEEYQDIWLGEDGYLQAILDAGFDGVYLDWVEAYSDEDVSAFALEDGIDARQEMIWWVEDIGEYGRVQNPDFIVIGQNAAELAQYDDYIDAIDAIAQEQVWFDGGADNDPPGDCPLPRTYADVDTDAYYNALSDPCRRQYDDFPESTLHVSSEEYLHDLTLAQNEGVIIFTVDYALEPDNIAWVARTARSLGFIPFVGSRALDRFVEPIP